MVYVIALVNHQYPDLRRPQVQFIAGKNAGRAGADHYDIALGHCHHPHNFSCLHYTTAARSVFPNGLPER